MASIGVRGLFVTDLDGTLLDDRGAMPDRNRTAIAEATANGIVVAVATGRRLSTVHKSGVLDGLDVRLATSNGAVVLAPDNRTVEALHPLPWSLADAIADLDPFLAAPLMCYLAPEDPLRGASSHDACVRLADDRTYATSSTLYRPESWTPIDPTAVRHRPLVEVALHFADSPQADAAADHLAALLPPSVQVHVVTSPSGVGALTEVVPRGGKGLAVAHLLAQLGLDKAASAGLGDELNDQDLLDATGHRFTVGKSVLAARRPDATIVADANTGAVADALGRFRRTL